MKYLVLSLILVSSLSMAAEKKKAATTKPNSMSELGKIDSKTLDLEPKAKNEDVTDQTALLKESDVKVSFACKEKSGHEVKQGEAGYEACLQQMKMDKNNTHAPNADLKVDFKK